MPFLSPLSSLSFIADRNLVATLLKPFCMEYLSPSAKSRNSLHEKSSVSLVRIVLSTSIQSNINIKFECIL
jgi:hypothetical protein